MNILIINAGSSSIKYQVITMPSESVICEGLVERIGSKDAVLIYKTGKEDLKETCEIPHHQIALKKITDLLLDSKRGVISDTKEIEIVGHRVVHGGNSLTKTTLISDQLKEQIKELSTLAPLHNPHNLEGIVLAEKTFPSAKQVAVFDTAFHQTLPAQAKRYALPDAFYSEHGIQVYGFHGISHKYVADQAIKYLRNQKSKIITIHLGNGCSMTAVLNGKSVDHSMGFTPSNGLIMGSRSGDIDHSLIFHMVQKLGYGLEEVNELLNKQSGLLGLTGHRDLRNIEAEAEKGNALCQLALLMSAYRIKKYIGAYTAAMNGLEAVVFTAGIGENSSVLRNMVCEHMDYLGMQIDTKRNQARSQNIREISTDSSKVRILVIPTNEELEIAKEVYDVCS